MLYPFPFTPEVAILTPPQSPRSGGLSLFPFDDEGDRDHAVELVTYRVSHLLVSEDRSATVKPFHDNKTESTDFLPN